MIIAAQADLHYGKKMYRTDENNHNKYEAATYKAGKEFTQIIVNRKPKVVVNAGDSFETAEPSVLALTKFREMQQSFEDNGIITLTINGNHDFKFANRKNRCSAPDYAAGHPDAQLLGHHFGRRIGCEPLHRHYCPKGRYAFRKIQIKHGYE